MGLPSLFNENGEAPKQTEAAKTGSKEITVEPNIIAELLGKALKSATVNWPLMKEKAIACSAAISLVKEIKTDEEFETAKKLYSKSAATYDVINKLRTETTDEFDKIKKKMMEPEKRISKLATEKDSELLGLKNLINAYANKKFEEQQAAEKEAKRVEDETFEISRLKAEFQLLFNNKVIEYAQTMETGIANYFNTLTLDGWDEKIKKFSLKPALKVETFNTWFDLPYDKTKLSVEKYKELVDQVKDLYTYDLVNGSYVESIQPKVTEWKGKLPAKKKELKDMEALAKKDKKAAEALQKKQEAEQKEQLEKINSDAQNQKDNVASQVQKQQLNENLSATFENQKVVQNAQEIGGKKTRIGITQFEPKNVAVVFSQLLFHCLAHEDFEGYLKKDKETGLPLPIDQNGKPQYTDWAKKIIDFVAEKTDVQVEGMLFKEIFIASTRVKKEKETE